MAYARPFWTSTLQDLSNGIKNTPMQGVLTPAIKLWVFESPKGLQVPTFGSVNFILTLSPKWGCDIFSCNILKFGTLWFFFLSFCESLIYLFLWNFAREEKRYLPFFSWTLKLSFLVFWSSKVFNFLLVILGVFNFLCEIS